ncbi:MAG: hypothetical protein ACYC3W_03205 [Candidatus Nanopelagicales bacterium]
MERYTNRLYIGTALMAVGFLAEVVMLSGLVTADRPPQWFWGLMLLVGVGAAVIVSAFRAAGRDRRDRTVALLSPDGGSPRRG